MIVARNRKWDGTAHWVVPGAYLGEDEFGWWVYQAAGAFCSRPGAAFHTRSHNALLIPREGDWVATFYDDTHPGDVRLYVDMAVGHEFRRIRPAVTEFHMVDMDLDVILLADGTAYVDDEDEFAERRVSMHYPAWLVEATEGACRRVLTAVQAEQTPFTGVAERWLARGLAATAAGVWSDEWIPDRGGNDD
ncbi:MULTISPECIES: DUF402 domain-containing protein [Arthrobacter]|uniref:DUF402 domain-containing protein n=3 Tax=Arthrobacter TaxID=1663 RepID=A0ABU9KHM8_9MICC|nr:DUF402 domain-containing protein [Arthrobacter sp. YJM1]MDP5225874.1 DUF402 domain-containing protein [Arthrobacter sp. YJM1]